MEPSTAPAAWSRASAASSERVSGGSVVVPKLTGMTRQEALTAAESLGLRITDVREYPTDDASRFEIVADQIFLDGDRKAEVGEKVIIGTSGTIVVYADASRIQKE